MTLRLPALLSAFLVTATLACAQATPTQPNFLIIMVDDLNDWIGPMKGHPQAITPNMDRLAAEGLTFLNAHCPAPLCGPSRAALWTGRSAATTGIYFHIRDDQIMDNLPGGVEAVFLPDLLEAHGYHTLGAGKLFHAGDMAHSFDEYGPGFSFGPKPSENMRLNFEPNWTGPRYTSTDWGAFPQKDEQLPDYDIRQWAVERIDAGIQEPFFMGVGFVRPHVPWYVPQKWFDLFKRDEMQTPPYLPDDMDDVPAIAQILCTIPGFPTTEWAQLAGEWQAIVQAYLACVAFTDYQIGQVLDALAGSPYADNTIVVLMGDNGYHLGEKNRFAKMALWERSTKVPFIFAGPGIVADATSDQPVNLLDFYPTVLELAGVPARTPLEGYSLVPLLRDPERADWEHVSLTTHGRNNHSVRDRNFRYIRYEDGSEELYDHRTDSWEHTNLASDPAYAGVLERLRQGLPQADAPLAKDSHLDLTPYLRERSAAWRKP
ncbi:sulfatase [Ruficoccus amylovorans]|uniref:Sulfatase n=1 Tax=Ruficoccus amylovorans TaxID=1804625 RepID=A0A842HKG2_9BACT|nr:sulfatase [Ruficoccus amylovorans]MBC2596164.1 sulfatase [Ruficoccus amylovorans]